MIQERQLIPRPNKAGVGLNYIANGHFAITQAGQFIMPFLPLISNQTEGSDSDHTPTYIYIYMHYMCLYMCVCVCVLAANRSVNLASVGN